MKDFRQFLIYILCMGTNHNLILSALFHYLNNRRHG